MRNFSMIFGKHIDADPIAEEAMAISGNYPTGELLIALVVRNLCEKIEALESRISALENSLKNKDDEAKVGMWCRNCGGSCDLVNCGMEQP